MTMSKGEEERRGRGHFGSQEKNPTMRDERIYGTGKKTRAAHKLSLSHETAGLQIRSPACSSLGT